MSEQQGVPYAPHAANSGKAVAALVLGIVSIVFCWAWGIIGLVTGIIGLVLGISAKKEAPSGMATAGIVLSIIGIVFSGIWLICCIAVGSALSCAGCAGVNALSSYYR